MEENRRTKTNNLKKKIEQGIRRTGFNEDFINAVKFHLEVIDSKIEESNIKSEYDYCNLLMSKLFIDTIDLYPIKRFKCQVNENSDWPVPLLPLEVFGDVLADDYRKNSFYMCVQVGDLLACRVASVLPTEYRLRVIHKYGAARILDDLNITVLLRRNDSGLLLLEKELFPCDLIRVLVSELSRENENKIFVTVSDDIGEFGEDRQLGRISEDQLPTYVLDPPEHSSSYSDYLKSLPRFHNPILLKSILEDFGINPRGVYSSYPTCESLKSVDANLLLKEANLGTVKYLTDLAMKNLESKNVHEALLSVQKAIDLYPMKDQTTNDKIELKNLYEIRGIIHAEIQKMQVSKEALMWELEHKTGPTVLCGNKYLSRVLFQIANKCYKLKDYKNAAEVVEDACKLDKNDKEASALLQYLKSKHPEAYITLEEESLLSLEEKKKEIENELKKIPKLKTE